MIDTSKNYGLDTIPEITRDHFVFGGLNSLPQDILQPDGQWDDFLPTYEPQFGGDWDTDGCTVWGTQNAIEILTKRLLGGEPNFSERFTYNLVPVRPPGSDPHKVIESIRNCGLVSNDELPMTGTYEEFLTPSPMSENLLNEGKQWLGLHKLGHEWVPVNIENLKKNLTYSPLGVAVTAWNQDADGIYRDQGMPNCHWCACYGFDDEKRAWKIFDSYDQSKKLYSYDSLISCAKRYSLENALAPRPSFLQNIFACLSQ